MAVGESLVHRHFVGVFEIAADGQPHCDARDAEAERFEQARQVIRRSLAFGVRVCGENDFLNTAFAAFVRAQAFKQVLIRSSSGPMPLIGESAPCSTW